MYPFGRNITIGIGDKPDLASMPYQATPDDTRSGKVSDITELAPKIGSSPASTEAAASHIRKNYDNACY